MGHRRSRVHLVTIRGFQIYLVSSSVALLVSLYMLSSCIVISLFKGRFGLNRVVMYNYGLYKKNVLSLLLIAMLSFNLLWLCSSSYGTYSLLCMEVAWLLGMLTLGSGVLYPGERGVT